MTRAKRQISFITAEILIIDIQHLLFINFTKLNVPQQCNSGMPDKNLNVENSFNFYYISITYNIMQCLCDAAVTDYEKTLYNEAAICIISLQISCKFHKQSSDHCSAVDIHGHLNPSLLLSFLPSSSMEGDRSQNANKWKQKKVKMLMATAFLRSLRYLLGITGLVAAFFDYFQREWMIPNRLPLWNAYNKNIQTNNYLDGWYFRINWQVRKHHLSFYELL
ncbi:hypothetical protein T07_5750 [Trichinella nelsoni]|uniref:Uncharacterized protein n=1 Tax=Trichinella nelsoni TaxID=6336 RepID=A0A0V0RFT9_9BILA|nr:hypothetical protein T07_11787 [Trichinella nelsoni]KRX13361.1 hypothetical protein T07_5750 [Trichinella nelsoni]